MGSVGQQLEELNKQSAALLEKVEAASEACKTAAEASTRAELACSKSPENKDLQVLRDAAAKEEQRTKEMCCFWQERMKQLDTTRAQLAAKLPGNELTLREAVAYPIPLLEKRLSPRKSHSKTQPRLSRTFSDIFPWQDFRERSRELFNGLDDTEHIYPKTVSRILPRGSVLSAADECEVRGRVVIMLDSVNDIAQRLNIPVQCTGGGSGRSMCFTDLVVRPTGAQSNPANLSSQILGTGEVKGDWQFQLKRGERLEDALHDPKRIGNIVQTIQQVYGDAVMDEAPLLILTNYHVTVFLKRSEDVQDKRLWASEPIWYDQTDPPARASWVHGLQQAKELRDLKRRLPRAIVSPTVEGYHIQPRPQQAHREHQQAAAEQQVAADQQAAEAGLASSRKRQRTRHVSLRLQARSPSCKGYEVDSQGSLAPQQAAANLTDSRAEETITQSELGLTGELLGAGQYGYTLKGICKGEPVAVKVYNLQQHGAAAAYKTEKLAYQELEALQGKTIPHLLRSGLLLHTSAPVIVTSLEGDALEEDERVPKQLHKPIREALKALHTAGAAHGDVRRSNFLVSGGKVQLVDLGQTVLQASKAQKKADMQSLKAMLPL